MVVELITIALSSSGVTAVITAVTTTIINRRSRNIDNMKNSDAVLIQRIEFLDRRVEKLENLACYNKDCKDRV